MAVLRETSIQYLDLIKEILKVADFEPSIPRPQPEEEPGQQSKSKKITDTEDESDIATDHGQAQGTRHIGRLNLNLYAKGQTVHLSTAQALKGKNRNHTIILTRSLFLRLPQARTSLRAHILTRLMTSSTNLMGVPSAT